MSDIKVIPEYRVVSRVRVGGGKVLNNVVSYPALPNGKIEEAIAHIYKSFEDVKAAAPTFIEVESITLIEDEFDCGVEGELLLSDITFLCHIKLDYQFGFINKEEKDYRIQNFEVEYDELDL